MKPTLLSTVLVAVLLSGCASMPPGEKAFIAGVAIDSATTVYGLTSTDNLHEAGPLSWGDDWALGSALIVDAALVYFAHRMHERFPDWAGWPAVWYSFGGVKGLFGLQNLRLILEEGE